MFHNKYKKFFTINKYNKCLTINKCKKCCTINKYNKCFTINKYSKCFTINKYNKCVTINKYNKCFTINKYKKCFTESKQKFLSEKSFETSNFYGLPEIRQAKVIEAAIHSQNTEVADVREPSDLKTNWWRAKFQIFQQQGLVFLDTLLKPYLKHVKSYIRDIVDFLNKFPREVDPDTEIATFNVASLYTSIPHE